MSNLETQRELITSNAYWENPLELPQLSRVDSMRDLIERRSDVLHLNVAKLYLRMLDGCIGETIPEGEPLPIFSQAEPFLLKIVKDRRIIGSKRRLIERSNKTLDEKTFNERARDMMQHRLYDGLSATFIDDPNSDGQIITTRRDVSYLIPSSSGRQLAGVDSYDLQEFVRFQYNCSEPPLLVGETYRLDRKGNRLGKIALAMMIKPIGGQKGYTAAFFANRELTLQPSFVPVRLT